jgi:hypothetical protein
MLLPLQTVGICLQSPETGISRRSGLRPSLPRAGGSGCPDDMIPCACGSNSMCCDPYAENCWVDGNGDCWCIPRNSIWGGGTRPILGNFGARS